MRATFIGCPYFLFRAFGTMREVTRKTEKRKRNSAMDIIRIIAMFFIVGLHLVQSNVGLKLIESAKIPAAHFVPLSFLNCVFIIGVNLFFLLSGYFKINFSPAKILSLVFKVYFYWLISQLIALACGIYTPKTALDFFFGFVSAITKYWFIAVYILLCVAAPLLNSFVQSLTKKTALYFVFVSVVFFMIAGFVADAFYPYFGTGEGFLPVWAWVVYVYGRLIRIYRGEIRIKTVWLYVIWAASTLLNFAAILIIYLGFGDGNLVFHFYAYNNPLVMLSSLSIFVAFDRIKAEENGKVSCIAGHTLAVYLLHSNNPLVSPYRGLPVESVTPFWAKIALLFPNMLCLFALGITVDIIYESLLGRFVYKGLSKLELKIKRRFSEREVP